MFLEQTAERNSALLETAFCLHQSGKILPDTYVVDVDTFLENARRILEEAEKGGIRLYFMLKQLGRNPYLARELVKLGYRGAVTVDYREAEAMMENGIPIGNVGHLVQVPRALVKPIVAYGPEVITVYSREKLGAIQKAAEELKVRQGILLRVHREGDMIYSGQTAGFSLEQAEEAARWAQRDCPNVEIKGVTSFPCYLYDEAQGDIVPTPNLETVKEAERRLNKLGLGGLILNTPSATCCRTIEQMRRWGGNCGEPGHGLSGTTPLHAAHPERERPAVVYVSEISHNFQGKGYCFGGGHYRRSHVKNALVGKSREDALWCGVHPPLDESIDYHFGLDRECPVGDTVLMAFRFQIFVTRSQVALVRGLHAGKPELAGIYDSQGRKREER